LTFVDREQFTARTERDPSLLDQVAESPNDLAATVCADMSDRVILEAQANACSTCGGQINRLPGVAIVNRAVNEPEEHGRDVALELRSMVLVERRLQVPADRKRKTELAVREQTGSADPALVVRARAFLAGRPSRRPASLANIGARIDN
jgi:hypothetical protein